MSFPDDRRPDLDSLFRLWSETVEQLECHDGRQAAKVDGLVAELMNIERAIMAAPAETVRTMSMKVIIAARVEGINHGEHMRALVDEAHAILASGSSD